MLFSLLIGAAIGALIGAAIIGICECLSCASEIFDNEPAATQVEVIKSDSELFDEILMMNPRIRRAMRGDPTAIVLTYERGRITGAGSMSGELSSDFDDCSGYRINRRNRDNAIAI